MKRKKDAKKRKEKMDSVSIKDKVTKMLEIPDEVVSDRPKITSVGRKEVFVENYKGIIEFTNEIVRINSNYGIITITGENMKIKEITCDDIVIVGDIGNIDYVC